VAALVTLRLRAAFRERQSTPIRFLNPSVEEDVRLQSAGLALAAVLCAAPASAHEIGKTQVTATIARNGTYQVDIVIDPDALLAKLEAFGRTGATPREVARLERDRRIQALRGVFLDRVSVWFDDARSGPRFEYRPATAFNDLAQTPSIARLTGTVPRGAREFSLAYGLAMGSYALNVKIGDSPVQTVWISGTDRSAAVSLVAPPAPPGWRGVAWQYFGLGYTHILPKGADHILFVIGIFLLSARWRSILLQVSTFTIAHSITLGLTMYGVVSLPAKAVEPLIALSIAYVAVENLFTAELKPWRLALVFSFGLLHGMGFAGVLRDLGLPRSQFVTALLTFNAGVEAGQLSVIALSAAAVAYWRSDSSAYRRVVIQPASLLIASIGLFWTIQRALP
jgi:hydrogenase/urease accessory protein HupE